MAFKSKPWSLQTKPLKVSLDYPPSKGLIAIIGQEQSRYTKFWAAFTSLLAVTPNVSLTFHVGNQLAKCRNDAIEKAKEMNVDWLWFIDDDHDFSPDILKRLLSHNVDIVGPAYCLRGYPFDSTARRLPREGEKESVRKMFSIPDSGPPGLHEVLATGTSGMLIRKSVWTKIDRPWFTVGHLHPELISEDFFFCDLARKNGFKIYLDTSTILEHYAVMKVSHQYINNAWKVVIDGGRNWRLALNYVVKESDEQPADDGE